MKAFLSHFSGDKAIVGEVANYLGRWFAVYDIYSFEDGKDFHDSITQNLFLSDVFVLFLSKKTLSRDYVKDEITQAESLFSERGIKDILLFAIESDFDLDFLPSWLKTKKIHFTSNYKTMARAIIDSLSNIQTSRMTTRIIGRDNDISNIEDLIFPLSLYEAPKCLFIYGLEGIGRKKISSEISLSKLKYARSVVMDIENSDTPIEIAYKLISLVGKAEKEVEKIYRELKDKGLDYARVIIEQILSEIEISRECLVFLDRGGMINQDGTISSITQDIIEIVNSIKGIFCFFITTRKPRGTEKFVVTTYPLRELTNKNMSKLLGILAKDNDIILSEQSNIELTDFLGGFPPAAYQAIYLAKNYGIDMLSPDKKKIVNFRTSFFLNYIEEMNQTEQAVKILRLLAFYSPLPSRVIGAMYSLTSDVLQDLLAELIDTSLIIFSEDGFYSIATPITEAVYRSYGMLEKDEHGKVDKLMKEVINEIDSNLPSFLSLCRLSARASFYSNNEISSSVVMFHSDYVNVADVLYKDGDYDKVIQICLDVLKESKADYDAWSLLIRSYIQRSKFNEADKAIEKISVYAQPKDIFFFKGFRNRKSEDTLTAIHYYEKALSLGHGGKAINRELAQCYLMVDPKKAEYYILKALAVAPDDPFNLELLAKISTKNNDKQKAYDALDKLREVDKFGYYEHRCSTVALHFGEYEKAKSLAIEALKKSKKPTFGMIVQMIQCYIAFNEAGDAQDFLDILRSKFKGRLVDIQSTIQCKILNIQEKFEESYSFFQKINNKQSPYSVNILREILQGLISKNIVIDGHDSEYFSKQLESLGGDDSNWSIIDIID